jgi:hypothetical protein
MRSQITAAEPGERFAIPLDEAWYCESCRVILNDSTCFCCASREHIHRLAAWLDRDSQALRVPDRGVFITVTPESKKLPKEAEGTRGPQRLPRAS